jgi:hypothetical protein
VPDLWWLLHWCRPRFEQAGISEKKHIPWVAVAVVWGNGVVQIFFLGVQMAEIFLSRAYLDHGILIGWCSCHDFTTKTHSYSFLNFPLDFLKLPVQLRNPCFCGMLIIALARFIICSLMRNPYLLMYVLGGDWID